MVFRRAHKRKEKKDLIAWRGSEVRRIEAFSDAVFGFAITLLIVSLEVPKSYEEFITNLSGFIPFSICFAMFFQIWVTQNLFFRRYGLHDEFTLFLNAVLLFMVLFFVYPLKFLWNVLIFRNSLITDPIQFVHLMYIYGGGFTAIYLLFTLMYWHAKRRREYLELTDSEVFETKTYMYRNLSMALVGILSIVIASFGPEFIKYSGMSYMLTGVVIGVLHAKRGKIHHIKFEKNNLVNITASNEPAEEKIKTE
jgi:uncharacterized membrane protein